MDNHHSERTRHACRGSGGAAVRRRRPKEPGVRNPQHGRRRLWAGWPWTYASATRSLRSFRRSCRPMLQGFDAPARRTADEAMSRLRSVRRQGLGRTTDKSTFARTVSHVCGARLSGRTVRVNDAKAPAWSSSPHAERLELRGGRETERTGIGVVRHARPVVLRVHQQRTVAHLALEPGKGSWADVGGLCDFAQGETRSDPGSSTSRSSARGPDGSGIAPAWNELDELENLLEGVHEMGRRTMRAAFQADDRPSRHAYSACQTLLRPATKQPPLAYTIADIRRDAVTREQQVLPRSHPSHVPPPQMRDKFSRDGRASPKTGEWPSLQVRSESKRACGGRIRSSSSSASWRGRRRPNMCGVPTSPHLSPLQVDHR